MTIRPPVRATRTSSFATSNGLGANIAPKMLTTRSKLSSSSSLRSDASPSWNLQLVRPRLCARAFPAATRLLAMSTPRTFAPSLAAAEVEDVESVGDSQRHDQSLAALAHALCDASEVALLPERLVRIDGRGHRRLRSARV